MGEENEIIFCLYNNFSVSQCLIELIAGARARLDLVMSLESICQDRYVVMMTDFKFHDKMYLKLSFGAWFIRR